MTLEKAIKLLEIKYNIAITKHDITKPISWALYQTAKEVKKKEKARRYIDDDTSTEES